ncbi:LETM1 domain containing protein [Aphelenchoides besseyi]|nr:LETM1 domain containing protein [Aphelenchoides besseyi]KAI6198778.1 LETM1 domain containing protein [Aphelenchoides besseyi]
MFAAVVRNSALIPRVRCGLHRSGVFNSQFRRFLATHDHSKIEETLRMLKEDLTRQQEEDALKKKALATVVKKLPLKEKIVHELKHYYHGFRLLILETRLSIKYLFRLVRGDVLSRRERQQLVRTVSDLFRLVPFSFFIIVPFMELALPFFIKFFPNMLPSTFQDASKEDEKLRKQLKVRIEMAKFLQDTLEEIGLERRDKKDKQSKAYEFAQFLRRVRTHGSYVSNEEIFEFAKFFEDELTLDTLAMSQLRALCRILGIQSIGTPEILRFQLTLKLRELKADDRLITSEGGVDALSTKDLQAACRARGMRSLGMSEDRLREQLKQWLELSLNDKVPPSLLLLSRALYLPEDFSFGLRLRTIVADLPETLNEETRQKLTKLEGGQVDYKERLALIKHIEESLKQERKESVAKQKKEASETKKADVEKTENEKENN